MALPTIDPVTLPFWAEGAPPSQTDGPTLSGAGGRTTLINTDKLGIVVSVGIGDAGGGTGDAGMVFISQQCTHVPTVVGEG